MWQCSILHTSCEKLALFWISQEYRDIMKFCYEDHTKITTNLPVYNDCFERTLVSRVSVVILWNTFVKFHSSICPWDNANKIMTSLNIFLNFIVKIFFIKFKTSCTWYHNYVQQCSDPGRTLCRRSNYF